MRQTGMHARKPHFKRIRRLASRVIHRVFIQPDVAMRIARMARSPVHLFIGRASILLRDPSFRQRGRLCWPRLSAHVVRIIEECRVCSVAPVVCLVCSIVRDIVGKFVVRRDKLGPMLVES